MGKRALNPLLNGAWANIRSKRHDLEAKAREDINREMERYSEELAIAVYSAIKLDGHSYAELCRVTGASRPTVYSLVDRGEELAGGARNGGLAGLLNVKHPNDAYFSWDGDTIVINWPQWMNPDASDWEKRQRHWFPMDVTGTVQMTEAGWRTVVVEPDYREDYEGYQAANTPEEKMLNKALGAESFQNALNEWSGK